MELDALTEADLPAIDPALTPAVLETIDPARALAARRGVGSTAPDRVREQLAEFARTCAAQRDWAARMPSGPALRRGQGGRHERYHHPAKIRPRCP
ncbi:hypothetical protein DFP89_12729 [Paracoccus lutimaris]|uniref:Uncharacterized protein n=2 Tax=Paracoccus lutimaris TaxID=1490030 RepID=A0A368YGA8_9RHOB|nr:hypothetical protein DFP89_12729 [Paracoccus lutimaris]